MADCPHLPRRAEDVTLLISSRWHEIYFWFNKCLLSVSLMEAARPRGSHHWSLPLTDSCVCLWTSNECGSDTARVDMCFPLQNNAGEISECCSCVHQFTSWLFPNTIIVTFNQSTTEKKQNTSPRLSLKMLACFSISNLHKDGRWMNGWLVNEAFFRGYFYIISISQYWCWESRLDN